MRSVLSLVVRGTLVMTIAAWAGIAGATPVSYSEAVSGDLGTNQGPLTVFTLDTGLNTVSGTSFMISPPPNLPPNTDFDWFGVTVPVGTHLAGITYAFGVTLVPGTTGASLGYFLDQDGIPGPPYLQTTQINFLLGGATLQLFAPALPLGPGTFGVLENDGGVSGGGGWTIDYTWTFTVVSDQAAVPEPASVSLLGIGLAGVWLRRKRR